MDQLPPVSRARKTSTTSISSLEMGTFDLSDSVDALVTEHELTSTLNKPPQHNRSEHYVRRVSGVQTPASKQVTKGLQSPTQPVQTSSDDKRTVSSSRSQTLKTQKTNHTISNKSWVHQTHRGNHQLIEVSSFVNGCEDIHNLLYRSLSGVTQLSRRILVAKSYTSINVSTLASGA